jgi:hypothetical protein
VTLRRLLVAGAVRVIAEDTRWRLSAAPARRTATTEPRFMRVLHPPTRVAAESRLVIAAVARTASDFGRAGHTRRQEHAARTRDEEDAPY